MKLPEIQQEAMQARMSLIVGADNYDRLFAGAVFDEVEKGVLYCFARSEDSRPGSRTGSAAYFN
jgi:hypothetical protein